jgi:hypothetical protein
MLLKSFAIGETDAFSPGGTIVWMGSLFLVITLLTALRTSGRKGKVASYERMEKIYGKAAVGALLISLPLSFLFGALLSSNARLMTVVTPMYMLLIPIGFFAVTYIFVYQYYSRKE